VNTLLSRTSTPAHSRTHTPRKGGRTKERKKVCVCMSVYVLVCVYLSYCSYVYIFYLCIYHTTQYLYYAVAGSIAHFN
jgi:hypothetical protein